MNVFELVGCNENHQAYRDLDVSNRARQLDFLKSLVYAAVQTQTPVLSQTVIKALNFHAIGCLHAHAGLYRPCAVTVGNHEPPDHFRVASLMEDMVNKVNRWWDVTGPFWLAAYVLWRINWIHPFVNGNGRTARAACYFVICLHAGFWPSGYPILPERLKGHPEYLDGLTAADTTGDLRPLENLIWRLLSEQAGQL